MDSGRFAALVIIMFVLAGAVGFFAYSQTQGVEAEIAKLQTQVNHAATEATEARMAALNLKAEADKNAAAAASLASVQQMAKQASDAATAAQKEADEAKQVAEAGHGKTRR